MEFQIKKAVKAGNSSAVVLPRAWLNKEVRVELVEKTPDIILFESLNIARKYISLESIIGVYLTGSYARGEEDKYSDIDILVITDNIDKTMITEGSYNILIISSELLKQKLKKDLFPIGQMITEAEPLLNSGYLSSINIKVTKSNISWYLETTEEKLKLIKETLDKARSKNKIYLDDRIAYTLILRIRTLYLIRKLVEKENYSKKEFIKLIRIISKGTNAYESYLAVKNNLEATKGINIGETERLYAYLKSEFNEIKKIV